MNATELEHAITSALLAELGRGETTPIREIHSHDFCEDGATLLITLSMGDGSDTFISLTPGRPISIYRTDAPKPPAKVRHLFAVRCESAR